jgi:hypothetical protein
MVAADKEACMILTVACWMALISLIGWILHQCQKAVNEQHRRGDKDIAAGGLHE